LVVDGEDGLRVGVWSRWWRHGEDGWLGSA
jgi:hypothetical protein